jgi:uncharacterized membrane protein
LFVLEYLSRKEHYRYLDAASPYLWGATAISAVFTVVLGFMHFAEGSFTGSSGELHRFYGTVVAAVAAGVALLRVSSFAPSYKPLFFPASLVLLVLVSITGHYGGNLTHGSTYLVEYAPQPLRSLAGLAPRRTITSVSTADPFADVIGPMLVERCASCHSEDKQESDLVLTTYAGVMRGGESGRVVVAGNTDLSELLRRIELPHDDEEFMPADGKTPLTDQQVRIIRWWIGVGAPAVIHQRMIATCSAVSGVLPSAGMNSSSSCGSSMRRNSSLRSVLPATTTRPLSPPRMTPA